MRSIFYTTIILFYSIALHAQNEHPKFTLGLNVFNMVHVKTPAIDLVADYRLSDNFSIRLDGGPMLNLIHKENIQVEKFSGWQMGAGLRYYFKQDPSEVYGMYVELRGKHKSYQATIAGDFNVENDFGNYKERINYIADIKEFNLQAGFGQSFTFDHFRMDIVVGLGPASVDIDYLNIPSDAQFDTNGSNLWNPDREYEPYPEHYIFFEWILGYTF